MRGSQMTRPARRGLGPDAATVLEILAFPQFGGRGA